MTLVSPSAAAARQPSPARKKTAAKVATAKVFTLSAAGLCRDSGTASAMRWTLAHLPANTTIAFVGFPLDHLEPVAHFANALKMNGRQIVVVTEDPWTVGMRLPRSCFRGFAELRSFSSESCVLVMPTSRTQRRQVLDHLFSAGLKLPEQLPTIEIERADEPNRGTEWRKNRNDAELGVPTVDATNDAEPLDDDVDA